MAIGTTHQLDRYPPITLDRATDGSWHVSVQLDATARAQLDATALTNKELCHSAQHALAHAQFGSQIYPSQGAVGIRVAESPGLYDSPMLFMDGREALWFVARTTTPDLRAFLFAVQRLADERAAQPQAPLAS